MAPRRGPDRVTRSAHSGVWGCCLSLVFCLRSRTVAMEIGRGAAPLYSSRPDLSKRLPRTRDAGWSHGPSSGIRVPNNCKQRAILVPTRGQSGVGATACLAVWLWLAGRAGVWWRARVSLKGGGDGHEWGAGLGPKRDSAGIHWIRGIWGIHPRAHRCRAGLWSDRRMAQTGPEVASEVCEPRGAAPSCSRSNLVSISDRCRRAWMGHPDRYTPCGGASGPASGSIPNDRSRSASWAARCSALCARCSALCAR